MRGSVTVTFALVFLLVFSFVISFFQFASYTARRAYHAAAALLATENFFAAYLEPLYSEYHIFAREAEAGKDMVAWTEECIGSDVDFMTRKREGELSLLRGGGADFSVNAVQTLTMNQAEGFLLQAEEAMRYRSPLLAKDLLSELLGMTEQAEAEMEVASAEAETATAYAEVEQSILELMELVDGVVLYRYDDFLHGRNTTFLADTFVKSFYTDENEAAESFERTEIYHAFLENSINPEDILDGLMERTRQLAVRMRELEQKEGEVRVALEMLDRKMQTLSEKRMALATEIDARTISLSALQREITRLEIQWKKNREDADALELYRRKVEKEAMATELEQKMHIDTMYSELAAEMDLQNAECQEERRELMKQRRGLEAEGQALSRDEERFVARSTAIAEKCEKAYYQTERIEAQLATARVVKRGCETILHAIEDVISTDSAAEYRKELEKYSFYESAAGYDFPQMRRTLSTNRQLLLQNKCHLTGLSANALETALGGLLEERERMSRYTFQGLTMCYGEMSLGTSEEQEAASVLTGVAKKGFLGLLTSAELSKKEIDESKLPSVFLQKESDGKNLFAMLSENMGSLFSGVRSLLPDREELLAAPESALLLQGYLMTHFSDFQDPSEGALAYELEYLISGKKGDTDNLSSFLMKVCVLRAVLHFISLYSDSERKQPVEQAALAACGVIGLPALKTVFVFLFLLCWAVEEAMVDASALLLGKKLSVYPTKKDASISFAELVLVSGKMIQNKAGKKEDVEGLGMSYREFLQMFLLMTGRDKKAFRALDLIQENLRLSYRKGFRVNRCIWSISYQTDGKEYQYAYE